MCIEIILGSNTYVYTYNEQETQNELYVRIKYIYSGTCIIRHPLRIKNMLDYKGCQTTEVNIVQSIMVEVSQNAVFTSDIFTCIYTYQYYICMYHA